MSNVKKDYNSHNPRNIRRLAKKAALKGKPMPEIQIKMPANPDKRFWASVFEDVHKKAEK